MAYKIQILPRWIIFLLDLLCVEFCIFFSFVVRLNFNLEGVSHYSIHVILGLALVVNALLFYTLKSYAGIIRYTNIEDTVRILIVNSIASLVYFAINFISTRFDSGQAYTLYPITIVTINFFIVNFVLISYRLLVRYGFKYYKLR